MTQLSHELLMISMDLEKELPAVSERIKLLAGLAWSQEMELQAHRLLEASRHGSRFVAQLAAGVEALTDEDANIVRPDFGKGGRS
jgi:hypothetical protein